MLGLLPPWAGPAYELHYNVRGEKPIVHVFEESLKAQASLLQRKLYVSNRGKNYISIIHVDGYIQLIYNSRVRSICIP